jgi:hypothetical protein
MKQGPPGVHSSAMSGLTRLVWERRSGIRLLRSKDPIYPSRAGLNKSDGFIVLSAAISL